MNSTNQLLQYVGGDASISKTKIIKDIQEYFFKMNNDKQLHITIYTTNVASLIGGTIIHSLLCLSIDKITIINKS